MLDKHIMSIWRRQEVDKIISEVTKEKIKMHQNGYCPQYVELPEYYVTILKDYNEEISKYTDFKIDYSKATLLNLKIISNPVCKKIKVL